MATLALVGRPVRRRSLPDRVVLGRWLSSGDYRVDLVFATDSLSLALASFGLPALLVRGTLRRELHAPGSGFSSLLPDAEPVRGCDAAVGHER
jgi:hypothetical protein